MTATKTLSVVTWTTFLVGLLTVAISYLAATFGGGLGSGKQKGGRMRVVPSVAFQRALSIGTGLMYLSLLMMPAIPLVHHAHKKDLNGYDWGSAVTQWLSYLALPVALYLWDSPKTSKQGAFVLGFSVLALIGSVVLANEAQKKRKKQPPSPSSSVY